MNLKVNGFHVDMPCACGGTTKFMKTLDSAGKPFFVKATDTMAMVYDAQEIARNSDIDHTIIYRISTAGRNDGNSYDVPQYHWNYLDASKYHWGITKAALPPELDKNITWIEPLNEVDHERSDWLGNFATELAKLANADGYRVTLFGFSSGEPEPEDWETPGMLRYLRYCESRKLSALNGEIKRNDAAISLHEYNLHKNTFEQNYPYNIGRFLFLHDICDKHNIVRPDIHFTEWGWERVEIPTFNKSLDYIKKAGKLYAPYDNIKGTAIWNLGNWMGSDIGNNTNEYIEPLTELILNTEYEDEKMLEELEKRINLLGTQLEELNQRVVVLEMQKPPNVDVYRPLGCDISRYQGNVDFEKMANNDINFVFIKATESNYWVDPRFDDNWLGAASAGIIRGIYHFYRFAATPQSQAQHFLETIYNKFGSDFGELPLLIDVEDQKSGANRSDLKLFLDLIELRTGVKPMIYTGSWWWDNYLDGTSWAKDYMLMEAEYKKTSKGNPVPPKDWNGRWDFWQWTSSGDGKKYGVSSTYIDLDIFNGYNYEMPLFPNWDIDLTRDLNQNQPPPVERYDLLEYMIGDGRLFELQNYDQSGKPTSQERNQTETGVLEFFIKKGENEGKFEHWEYDDSYIYLNRDSSPFDAIDGTKRFYTVRNLNDSNKLMPWCKRFMYVGEEFTGEPHHVQFYNKATCDPHPQNSGTARNHTKLIAIHKSLTFKTGISLNNVLEIVGNGESHFFAKGFGRVGWIGPHGESAYVSEIHAPGQRPDIIMEELCK